MPGLALLLLVTSACGGGSGDTGRGDERSGQRPREDLGEAALTIGGAPWIATNAHARLEDGTLTIRASNTDTSVGRCQELELVVADYHGVGDYETPIGRSRFFSTEPQTDVAHLAKNDPTAALQAIRDALQRATLLHIDGAKLRVTSSDDAEVVGTFSWQPPEGVAQPAIEGGTFRAKVK